MTLEERLNATINEQEERIAELEQRVAQVTPDPVEVIDELLDSILTRPLMHGAHSPHCLEILVMTALGIRGRWAPTSPAKTAPWNKVYAKWCQEFFEDEGPNALMASGRFYEKFQWEPHEALHDQRPEVWDKILGFYAELVRRERAAAKEMTTAKEA